MSLPVIKSIVDCTDFSKTVAPYLPQIYELPQRIFQSIAHPQTLKQIYLSTNPFISALALSLFLAPIFLIASEINKNYSQVDRFWSILPTVYNAHFAIYAHALGLPTRRLDSLLLFSTIWSVSLWFFGVVFILTFSDPSDVQLLAQRRLQHWFRRLSLECAQRIHKPTAILHIQCCFYLTCAKCRIVMFNLSRLC